MQTFSENVNAPMERKADRTQSNYVYTPPVQMTKQVNLLA